MLNLVILHHHLRPGGVRRVIELATPRLVAEWPARLGKVVLAVGEAPPRGWLRGFRSRLGGTRVEVLVHPALGYAAELGAGAQPLREQVMSAVTRLIAEIKGEGGVIWAHNLGLGRNLWLARELTRTCHRLGLPLLAHHHDWWFENRWHHFAAMRAAGFRTLASMAGAVFADSPHIAHLAINQADARILEKHFPGRACWLPNLVEPAPAVPGKRLQNVRDWLLRQTGEEAPVWLLPSRLLRRKNIAEALLLTRWLRPEAWLITTGGVSSLEEQAYAKALKDTAKARGWRLRLGVLTRNQEYSPSVPELIAASEAVIMTPLQEGFGLPYLEAAAARRPLVARELPNIAPDLARFGFRFPQSYREVLVDPALFDWPAEYARQRSLYRAWRDSLPVAARELAAKPEMLAGESQAHPVSFSRLTLTAQLEVLSARVEQSWELCSALNPWLARWRERAAGGRLKTSSWPSSANRWLGGRAYSCRFLGGVPWSASAALRSGASLAAQRDFLRRKLGAEYLYPLLWSSRT